MNARNYDILDKYQRGHSITNIARYYKITPQRVGKICKQADLFTRLQRTKNIYFNANLKRSDADFKLAERLDELNS